MAANENSIEVQIVLDDGSIVRGFTKMENQAEKTGKNLSGAMGPFGKIAAAAAVAIAAIGAALVKSANAAAEAEESTNKFNLALANSGKFSKAASDEFAVYAKSLENLTGIDDDVITKNAALLVSLGNLSGEGLERATKAALNLSIGIDKDLGSSFELINKAATGSAGALARYGIKIDESLPKSVQFSAALEQIEKRFGGLSEAAGQSFTGQLTKVGTAFNNMFESVGTFIVASPAIKATFGFIADGFNSIAKLVSQKGSVAFVDNLVLKFAEFAQFLANNVVPVVEFLVRAFMTGFRTIQYLIDALIAGTVFALAKLLAPFAMFNDKVKSFLDTLQQSTVDVANDSYAKLVEATESTFNTSMSTSIQTFVDGYKLKIDEAIAKNVEFSDSLTNASINASAQTLSIGQSFDSFVGGFKAASADLAADAAKNFAQVGKSMFQGLGQAAGQAFAAFGKAVVESENAIQAFIDSLVASFGQMAIQLGTQFILTGLAYSFAGLPNGGPLIAAGAALAAFGGILSAIGGKGKGSTPGASSSGGVGGGTEAPVTATPIGNPATAEAQKPQTKIEVNVGGSLLQTQDLIDVLNEHYDTTGAVVTGRTV